MALTEEEREFGFERVGSPEMGVVGESCRLSGLLSISQLSPWVLSCGSPDITLISHLVCLIRPPQQVLKAIFSPALS